MALPPKLEPPVGNAESPETADILLSRRPSPDQRSIPSEASSVAAAIAKADSSSQTVAGASNNENAAIGSLRDLPKPPKVQLKKTQPLSRMPASIPASVPLKMAPAIRVEPEPERNVDRIPTGLCWGVLILSAGILIIQIWTYLF